MDTCRFCGGETDLLVPLCTGEGVELQLETKIARHLPIHIASDDGLPQGVCYPCVDLLLTWDAFVTACIDMDAKLRAIAIDKTCDLLSQDISFNDSDDEPLIPPKKLKEECWDVVNNSSVVDHAIKSKVTDSISADLRKSEMKDEDSRVCVTCGKEFKNKRYLLKHSNNCGRKEELTCGVCNASYKSRANLRRHMKREHQTNQEKCPVCEKSICSSKMATHLRMAHSIHPVREPKFKCKMCDQWFTNKYAKNEHIKLTHQQEPVKCEFCDYEGFRNVVKRHMRTVHSTKQFPCSKCSAVCKTVHLLKAHMTTHSDLRSYTCDICGMGFKRLNNVRDHMKCHQKKSNQCQICGNFFARKRYLAIHEKTIHNLYMDGTAPEQKGFECSICGAKLKWKKNLLAHMRIHSGEKPYSCKICRRDFTCHGSLRTHMNKHAPADVVLLEHDPMTLEIGVIEPYPQPISIAKVWSIQENTQKD